MLKMAFLTTLLARTIKTPVGIPAIFSEIP
jgi:hypothetical protein